MPLTCNSSKHAFSLGELVGASVAFAKHVDLELEPGISASGIFRLVPAVAVDFPCSLNIVLAFL